MSLLLVTLSKELNSSVFVLLIVLMVVIALVAKVSSKLGMWTEKFKNQDEKLSNVQKVSDTVIELKTKIDLIYHNTVPNPLLQSSSPIELTEKGIDVSKEINANTIFEKYKGKLKKSVNSKNPKNAYDIQQISIEVAKNDLKNLLDEQEVLLLKDKAFAKGCLLEDILYIFAILLRNDLLSEAGISTHEIDDHDPFK